MRTFGEEIKELLFKSKSKNFVAIPKGVSSQGNLIIETKINGSNRNDL